MNKINAYLTEDFTEEDKKMFALLCDKTISEKDQIIGGI